MTTEQLATQFFPPRNGQRSSAVSSLCRQRLKLLFHHGLLHREELAYPRPDGTKPTVYMLDKAGAEYLAGLYQCDVRALGWSSAHNEVKGPFVEHALAIVDVRIAIRRAAERHGVRIVRETDEPTLRRAAHKDVVTITGPEGKSERVVVIPDGYVLLAPGNGRIYHCFLEIDRATETGFATKWQQKDFAQKVSGYLVYFHSGLYTQRYNAKGGRVLIVTTSEQRAENLKRVIERVGGELKFWLTWFDLVRTKDILFDPIWRVASRDGFSSLLRAD